MRSGENRSVLKEELQQLQRFAADDVPTTEDQRMYSLASKAGSWVVGAAFILTLLMLRRHLRQ